MYVAFSFSYGNTVRNIQAESHIFHVKLKLLLVVLLSDEFNPKNGHDTICCYDCSFFRKEIKAQQYYCSYHSGKNIHIQVISAS